MIKYLFGKILVFSILFLFISAECGTVSRISTGISKNRRRVTIDVKSDAEYTIKVYNKRLELLILNSDMHIEPSSGGFGGSLINRMDVGQKGKDVSISLQLNTNEYNYKDFRYRKNDGYRIVLNIYPNTPEKTDVKSNEVVYENKSEENYPSPDTNIGVNSFSTTLKEAAQNKDYIKGFEILKLFEKDSLNEKADSLLYYEALFQNLKALEEDKPEYLDSASTILDTLIIKDPDDIRVRSLIASVYKNKNDSIKAEYHYEKLIESFKGKTHKLTEFETSDTTNRPYKPIKKKEKPKKEEVIEESEDDGEGFPFVSVGIGLLLFGIIGGGVYFLLKKFGVLEKLFKDRKRDRDRFRNLMEEDVAVDDDATPSDLQKKFKKMQSKEDTDSKFDMDTEDERVPTDIPTISEEIETDLPDIEIPQPEGSEEPVEVDKNISERVLELHEQGFDLTEIEEILQVDFATVKKVLKENGMIDIGDDEPEEEAMPVMPDITETTSRDEILSDVESDVAEMALQMYEEGQTIDEVAMVLNLEVDDVRRIVDESKKSDDGEGNDDDFPDDNYEDDSLDKVKELVESGYTKEKIAEELNMTIDDVEFAASLIGVEIK